ncbi:MAG TPA: hypothetical protein VIL35_02485 [Vicinamibacterales bacterium]
MSEWQRFVMTMAAGASFLVMTPVRVDAETGGFPDGTGTTPPRFTVEKGVRRDFDRLLGASPTFRSQVDRIVAAGVHVVIVVAMPWELDSQTNAISRIVRQEGRVQFVRILLSRRGPWLRSLPHELEHIVEQLEGIDLARRQGRGVWRSAGGAFETRRAMEAGERALVEVRRYRAPLLAHAARAPASPARGAAERP